MRPQRSEAKVDLIQLRDSLIKYISSEPLSRSAELNETRALLFRLAGQDDALGEKVDRIQDNDYRALLILEHLFKDPQNLPDLIKQALGSLKAEERRELLRGKGEKGPIQGDGSQLLNAIKKLNVDKNESHCFRKGA